MRHVVVVRQALAAADALGASLTGLLDNSRIGVVHLDRGGRLVAANAPALSVLRAGDGLFDEDGALHARLPQDQARLQKLLGRALPSLWGEAAQGRLDDGRASLGGRRGWGCTSARWATRGRTSGVGRVAALVLLVDPVSGPRIDPAAGVNGCSA